MHFLHNIPILLILLMSHFVSAQTTYISGVVRSSENNQPVAHVEIINVQHDASTLTDHKGFFSIPIMENSVTVLIFRHLGYETDTLNINKIPDEPLEVFLHEKVSKLNEVEVFGDANQNATVLKTEITKIDLEKSPVQDIGSFLRTEPNMGGIRKGAMGIDPVIRGFKYSQLNVQINGGTKIEGGCPNRMDPATAHVDISDLQKITIYKGPYALKYGPNFGGMIRLVTNELSFNKSYETHLKMMVGGQTNYQGYKSRLNFDGGNKLLAYSLSTNWNKYGDYSSGNGETMQGASNNYNLKGQLGIQPVAGQKFYVGYDRSWGKNIDFPTLPMDERNDNTEIYDFSY
ncbi:MAG: carboxypeptidase-like regulatory domain-containing protein, partial [Bacteroidales bacterium]